MNKQNHITAFYVETILLIIVFMGIIMVLTNIFGVGKLVSSSARHLNSAVYLAGNAAEAVSASDSMEAARQLLDEAGNTQETNASETGFRVNYDENMQPSPEGVYHVDVTWEPEQSEGGTLVTSRISVFFGDTEQSVYDLTTSVFIKEEEG